MKKKVIIAFSAAVIAVTAAVVFMTVSYKSTDEYREGTLPENTVVNGVDCSGLSYADAAADLSDAWNKKHIIVSGELNETICEFTDFGCTYDISSELDSVKRDNIVLAALNHYIHTPFSVNIPMNVSDFDPGFKERVLSAELFHREGATDSADAYVDLSSPDFEIVPEVFGTRPDGEKFFNDLIRHIQLGEFRFAYESDDYSIIPDVLANDPGLLKYQKFCKKYLTQKITYSMGESTFTITPEELASLMDDDLSGSAEPAAVEDYVANMAEKYDNVGIERSFTTLAGKDVTIKGGTYGWKIDREAETAQLTSDINSHKDVERKPVYSKEGYGEYSMDVGNTYVEVDLSQQKVRFYRDGAEKFSCSVVTGNRAAGDSTPQGTYFIMNRLKGVVMRGDNDDGTRYEEPADYWMGVTPNGIGLHDSSWRTQFGGNIWMTNGSHGCINMPKNRIPQLFNMVEVGMPVIMYY